MRRCGSHPPKGIFAVNPVFFISLGFKRFFPRGISEMADAFRGISDGETLYAAKWCRGKVSTRCNQEKNSTQKAIYDFLTYNVIKLLL